MFVVEGYVDAIAMDQGRHQPCGRTAGHRIDRGAARHDLAAGAEPVLCFDGDKAGLRAAYRAIDVALPGLAPGKSLRFCFLPEGQDPDDLLRSRGPDALRQAQEKPRPLVEVLFEREIGRGPLENARAARGMREATFRRRGADSRR